MRVGQTYTRDFDLETRQHEILGVDLGEGPTRRAVVVGLLLLTVWTGGLLLLFGIPSKELFSLYVIPPVVVTVYGTQRSEKNARRWKLTHWALTLRYIAVGHRPIINGGRRAASRTEWLPLRARLGSRTENLATAPGMSALHEPEDDDPDHEPAAGPAIRLEARVRLYGPDRVYRAHKKEGRR
jgi:hypothetical protein